MDGLNSGKIVKAPQAISVSIGDEEVMLAIDDGVYYSLNTTGKYIWSRLEYPVSFEELVSAVQKEFETSKEDCQEAVHAFLEDLERYGLIIKKG